ncbi:hypothetical protein, partial [Rothia amarae]|uniref:hypothetical protein n=1 Tax=Rothia amarae TaxID=169480 RepID=UPI0037111D4D
QNTQIIKDHSKISKFDKIKETHNKPTKSPLSSFQKMLASTIQFSNNNPPTPSRTTTTVEPSNAPGKNKTTNNSLQPQNPTMRLIQQPKPIFHP